MDTTLFDESSRRVAKARLGKALGPWHITFIIAVFLIVLIGAGLLFLQLPVGWAVIGFAAIPAMIAQWYTHDLADVAVEKGGTRADQLLESSLLAILPSQPSPKAIAQAISQTNGGHFFAARFGIGGSFLEQMVPDTREDTHLVWTDALNIAKQTDGVITAGVLILAMVRLLPNKDTLLGHLQLSEEDLLRGVRWYDQLLRIKAEKQRPKRPGGIGRDWSFGWIPTLSRFGNNISEGSRPSDRPMREELIGQMVTSLGSGRGSIALVGRPGVGKTEVVYELAARLMDPESTVPKKLKFTQVFMLDASRIVSAAKGRGELEQLVSLILSEAYVAKNIIICLDNAHLFFEEGVGSADLTNLLIPILEAGRLPIIMTVDEQRFLGISQRSPALANAVVRFNVAPATEDQTITIMLDHLARLEYRRKSTFMYQALRESYRLGARYIYDTAMPGQAITLLDSAADHAENGIVSAASVALAVQERTGVKTAAVTTDSERETLLQLEALIHKRMIGQERAVAVVSDSLRRARAGVRNQKRPVGTFLFLGPTGVGKTELAKSLASVYFGGEDNIIRLDMNEFVSPNDVSRLIADAADDSGSLTAQVMKQPFSVVLLDEIEKAHSSVLTTLLQLLDEGILRDVRGREVSFRDTIVIATSNAGASRIQEYLQRGYNLAQFEKQFINELISSHLFHPEFLNRFDEIVVFGALSKPELLQVVDLIIAGINKNLASQRITVDVTPDAKEFLVEAGYDPRLGARPMRRVVQKAVENNVANLMLAGNVQPGSTITIDRQHVESVLGSHQQAEQIINDQKF